MALDFASMLLQPTKTSAWDLTPGGGSAARENLKLARERFEWEKKQALEEKRLAREKQAAEAARAKLEAENAKAAKLQEDRLKVYTEFTKQAGEGNVEATRAMVPMMSSLGMGVELEGEDGGLPRYRIDMDAAAAQQAEDERLAQTSPYGEGETAEQSLSRLAAMGLGGETGSLLPPLGIRASDEVDPRTGRTVADRVAASYGAPGEKSPVLDPETGQPVVVEPDYTGGIPTNVIDMGATAASTLARLDPALKSAAGAFPDEQTRQGAESIRQGLRASGLPFEKQAGLFDKSVGQVASQRNAQIGADAQAARFREQRDQLTEKDIAGLEKQGRDEGNKFSNENKISEVGKAFRAGDTILRVIDDPNPDNDAMIASELMTFQNVKGTPSDTDLKMAFAIPLSTAIDQALTLIGQMVKGGMQAPQREAIKAYMSAKRDELKSAAFEYLDQAQVRAGGFTSEHPKKGFTQNVKSSVPGWIYNEWLDMKKARDEGAGGDRGKPKAGAQYEPNDLAQMTDSELELESQALERGLDPEAIRPLMRAESGGDPRVKNRMGSSASGLFQFTDETAKAAGLENAAAYAALPPEKQIEIALDRFEKIGLDENSKADDYALANAAPAYVGKSDDTVIKEYKAGTDFGDKVRAQNPGWVPEGGGEITVGSIKAFYRGGKGKGGGKGRFESPALRLQKERAAKALPPPKTAVDQEVADILRKDEP